MVMIMNLICGNYFGKHKYRCFRTFFRAAFARVRWTGLLVPPYGIRARGKKDVGASRPALDGVACPPYAHVLGIKFRASWCVSLDEVGLPPYGIPASGTKNGGPARLALDGHA